MLVNGAWASKLDAGSEQIRDPICSRLPEQPYNGTNDSGVNTDSGEQPSPTAAQCQSRLCQ